VAVVILHVHKYEINTRKFKSGGLHEKHVVATGKLGNHLSMYVKFNSLHFLTSTALSYCLSDVFVFSWHHCIYCNS
jgi:hypothetical protein